MSNVAELKSYLSNMPAGPIEDVGKLEDLLVASWGELDGANQGGMEADKLSGRVEEIQWNPPILTFHIERHGGAVRGSSGAEMQHWELDVDRQVCSLTFVGRRQLRPMQPRLDVTPLAEKIAQLIETKEEDDRLKWRDDGRVRVLIGKILPEGSAVKQTLAARRKRFWASLDDCLCKGWERDKQTYSPLRSDKS